MSYFEVIGKTTDGKVVISGVFDLFSTNGVPLDVVFDWCKQNGYIPSWNDFYNEAKANGWKHKTILNRLKDNMDDIWDDKFINVVFRKLESNQRSGS